MDSPADQIVKEIAGMVRVYKDGRVQKLKGTAVVPAGLHSSTGVQSKDVIISPDSSISARLYIPKITPSSTQKLPLLIYYHGGGFIIETASSPTYHDFLNLIAAESNAVIVSVDYRTVPEYSILTCYEDSWEAIKWIAQHVTGNGPEPWLNDLADLQRVFFGGGSAGANIAHHMAIRVGSNPDGRINLQGLILLHPYFWGNDRIGCEEAHPFKEFMGDVWTFAHPETSGLNDPLLNPAMDPKVSGLKCPRILVCVAEKDILKDRGWYYKEILGENWWRGNIETVEDKGEGHVFFLFYPSAEIASNLCKRVCTFINV